MLKIISGSRKTIFSVLFIIFVCFFLFWNITQSFYQQDEWHGLGDILVLGKNSLFVTVNSPFDLIVGGGRLLGNTLVYFFYKNFPLNIFPIAVFIIILHTINAVLLFFLSKKFTSSIVASIFGALFFTANAVSQGAVTWPASGVGTLPATFLLLLSIFTFLKGLEEKGKKWTALTFILLYVSLFFKEIAIPFFFFFPLSSFLFKDQRLVDVLKKYWIFIIFCALTVSVKLLFFENVTVAKDLFLTGASQSFAQTILSRAVLYPMTSFSLVFLPPAPILEFAKHLTWVAYPFFDPSLYDLIAQTVVLDMISVFLTLVVLGGLLILFKRSSRKVGARVLFVVGFIAISFLPYIIISKSYAYLEARYYYVPAIGGAILLSLVLKRISESATAKVYIVFIILVGLFIIIHVKNTRIEVEKQVDWGQERISMLRQFNMLKPDLKSQSVIFLTGNRNYYISDGNPTPMQQGVGYTLLVWYEAQGKAPAQFSTFIRDYYLWEMAGQGYRDIDKFRFGYFWDREVLNKLVKEKKIISSEISSFYYDSKTKMLTNVTAETKWGK